MTTSATRLREAIIARLAPLPGYVGAIRRTPVPQIQPDKLPQLSVWIVGEALTPDGDANSGPPRFISETTIGISDIRGFATTGELDAQQDDALDVIEATLLTDPTFVRGVDPAKAINDPSRYPFFEAVERITRRRSFPQEGETYFARLQIDMVFASRVKFQPVIPDRLLHLLVNGRPAGAGLGTPPVRSRIDPPQ